LADQMIIRKVKTEDTNSKG